MDRYTIVLARAEEERVYDGEPFARDLGQRPRFVTVRSARALVWLNDGGGDDIAKAKRWASSEGYTVFTYPVTEPEPLKRARADVLGATP